ncbi:hypothetical protein RFI_10399, partial [Reticulomyxa filosa]
FFFFFKFKKKKKKKKYTYLYLATEIWQHLKEYKKSLRYPNQSRVNDMRDECVREQYRRHNRDNVLQDSLLAMTNNQGYWLCDLKQGLWYSLGEERPHLPQFYYALERGSVCCKLYPRTSTPLLYFAGGYVHGKTISTLTQLHVEDMVLSRVTLLLLLLLLLFICCKMCEMKPIDSKNPARSMCSMVIFPDCLMLIGGTNHWGNTFADVHQYTYMDNEDDHDHAAASLRHSKAQTWSVCPSLLHARYAADAITIDERFVFVAGGCNRHFPVFETFRLCLKYIYIFFFKFVYVYVIHGKKKKKKKKLFLLNREMFDRTTNQWQNVGQLLFSSQKSNLMRYRELVFIVSSQLEWVQHFDFAKQSWYVSSQNRLNQVYKRPKFSLIDDHLVVADRCNLSSYQLYDPVDGRWISTNSRMHPVGRLYPCSNPFQHKLPYNSPFANRHETTKIIDWFYLGREYW